MLQLLNYFIYFLKYVIVIYIFILNGWENFQNILHIKLKDFNLSFENKEKK